MSRKLKPITPGQRFRVVNGYDAITTDKPERSLIAPIKTLVVEIVKER
jgi:large subunit ribosomal protein L2